MAPPRRVVVSGDGTGRGRDGVTGGAVRGDPPGRPAGGVVDPGVGAAAPGASADGATGVGLSGSSGAKAAGVLRAAGWTRSSRWLTRCCGRTWRHRASSGTRRDGCWRGWPRSTASRRWRTRRCGTTSAPGGRRSDLGVQPRAVPGSGGRHPILRVSVRAVARCRTPPITRPFSPLLPMRPLDGPELRDVTRTSSSTLPSRSCSKASLDCAGPAGHRLRRRCDAAREGVSGSRETSAPYFGPGEVEPAGG